MKLIALVVLGWCLLPLGSHAYTPYTTPDAAFNPLSQPVGYLAQDELTDFDLTSGVETLFRPEYNRQYWSGNLHAYPISAAGTINLSAERWTGGAAQQITSQNPVTGRFIATMDGAGVGPPLGVRTGAVTGAGRSRTTASLLTAGTRNRNTASSSNAALPSAVVREAQVGP